MDWNRSIKSYEKIQAKIADCEIKVYEILYSIQKIAIKQLGESCKAVLYFIKSQKRPCHGSFFLVLKFYICTK